MYLHKHEHIQNCIYIISWMIRFVPSREHRFFLSLSLVVDSEVHSFLIYHCWFMEKCIIIQLVFAFALVDCPTWSYRNSETARSKKESYCQKTCKGPVKTKVARTCRGKETHRCTNWTLFGGIKWSCWRSWCWNTDRCLSWSTSFSIVHPCKEWSGRCNSNIGGRSMFWYFD